MRRVGSGVGMDTSSADQVVHFHQAGSHGKLVDDTSFTGKVPVVVTFALVADLETRATLIQGLDASLHEFGERRVQLLVAVHGDPVAIAAGLDVQVTLMADDGLAERLGAMPDEQGRIATVVLDNRGQAVDTVRQLPVGDHALAVLTAFDTLAADYPDRFAVLPDDATPVADARRVE